MRWDMRWEMLMRFAGKEQVVSRRKQRGHFFQSWILIAGMLSLGAQCQPGRGAETVHFRSGDGQTDLIG